MIAARIILFCSFVCMISATYPCHKPTCPPNQVYSDCNNHPCQDTCDFPHLSKTCKYNTSQKYPGCICAPGYVKEKDGSCIERKLCDFKCGSNEDLVSSPNPCPNVGTCDGPDKNSKPTCRMAVPRKGCQCKDGYFKDNSGKCIPKCQCPKKCTGANEIYSPGGPCEPNCVSPTPVCKSVPDCRCKEGYVRHFKDCIRICQCPKCGSNEEYKYEGPSCPATCKNDEGKKPCGSPCANPRVPGCFCKQGYVRGDNGKCIEKCKCPCPYSKRGVLPPKPCPTKPPTTTTPKPCPPKCGYNEYHTDEAPIFPEACDNRGKSRCNSTRPGCACKPGFIRSSSKKGAKCIRRCQCPPCK